MKLADGGTEEGGAALRDFGEDVRHNEGFWRYDDVADVVMQAAFVLGAS